MNFAVSPATLIPRPESETVVEAALAEFRGRPSPRRVLDLGTGTGCLLLAVLSEFPAAFGVGVDRFAAAALAASNAVALCLADRASFIASDWASGLDGSFDLVLCNPPYIPTSELGELMPDVVRYEPHVALDGGLDGYAAYRQVIPDLPRLLDPRGVAVLEVGAGQADTVADLAREVSLAVQISHDLSGIARALVLRPGAAMKKPFGSAGSPV